MNGDINNKSYRVGIYIRLSREDDDRVLESESITNQRSLLLQYVAENNYNLADIYIDDGYSGTNFDRPEFKRLIDDIEIGKINMVITKDMSRLGRDYIGTGNLIEKYFPEHMVRYIAVNDNIDTFTENVSNEIAPFRAIMNDMYARDISKKVKSSLIAKKKEGKWVSGRTPFGYERDPQNKNHLIVNSEQAKVIKRIFAMCLDGLSYYKIAKILTNEKVKTPAEYYSFEWKKHYNLHYGVWHPKTVQDILTNRIYIGDLVQNKTRKINYKIKKSIKNSPSAYIIMDGTHKPIIDKVTFYRIQRKLPKNVGRDDKKENHLLDGLLYCGDCGHRISVTPRRKNSGYCYTLCNYYRTYLHFKLCTTHSNNYDILEEKIISILKDECKKHMDDVKIRNVVKEKITNEENLVKIIDKYINKYLSFNNICRELVVELIDRIEIFENKNINIIMSFSP